MKISVSRRLTIVSQEQMIPTVQPCPLYCEKTDLLLSIMSFLRDLINNGVLPPIYEQPLKEISRAANEAVHGSDIFKFEAVRVVMLGTQMLEQLHAYPAKNSHKK